MQKFLKKVMIGAAIYGASELWFLLGKGDMLGIMAKYNTSDPQKLIDSFLNSDRLYVRTIAKVAQNRIKFKEES